MRKQKRIGQWDNIRRQSISPSLLSSVKGLPVMMLTHQHNLLSPSPVHWSGLNCPTESHWGM